MDVKKESLKELRNRILKLFGESLDDYIKDSESLSQQIQVLNGLRADTRSDIARLTRERDDITSTVTRYQEMRDKLKKELEIEAKTVREEIQNTKTQADSDLTRREAELKVREGAEADRNRQIAEKENLILQKEAQLDKTERDLTTKNNEVNRKTRENSKLAEDLARKEVGLHDFQHDLFAKLAKAKELDALSQSLSERETNLKKLEGEVDLNRKKATTELERLTNYSRELENREELLNSREVELNKKEIWLDDRLKTYKTHVV
ncbi:MAG TPA: hypothetical protein VJ327_00195 [Patescibacteria group bacterium]|nr:hypothetical protein [Patescibacteria group bacterium]